MSTHNTYSADRRFMLLFIISVFCLSSCAFYPKVIDDQNTACHLVSKKLTLEIVVFDSISREDLKGADAEEILVLLAGTTVIAVASAIISGSIMLAGNAIHWIEQQGTCDDGAINIAIDDLSESLTSLGVRFADSAEDIINWIKANAKEIETEGFALPSD